LVFKLYNLKVFLEENTTSGLHYGKVNFDFHSII